MNAVTEPGVYDLSAEVYHADPCPTPSLSGSVAIPLVHRSPRHAWWVHPKLNPDAEPVESTRFDLGSVAHKLLLGRGAEIISVKADDWRTNAAKAARDDARAAGKLPVLAYQLADATRMAETAQQYLESCGHTLRNGKSEQVLAWKEGDIWCRGLVDWLADDLRGLIDYKTTGTSANPADLERHVFDMYYHLKLAFYERGLNVLDPLGVGRRKMFLLFQENEAPFVCSHVEISEAGLTIGRKQATYAIRMWQRCMATQSWPGYPRQLVTLRPPPWVEGRWLEREVMDDFATGETAPTLILPTPDPKPLLPIGD